MIERDIPHIVIGYVDNKERWYLTSGSTFSEEKRAAKLYQNRDACWKDIYQIEQYSAPFGIRWYPEMQYTKLPEVQAAERRFIFWFAVSMLVFFVLCLGAAYFIIRASGLG